MSKLSLSEIFEKPISGEWGKDPLDENQIKVIKTNNILNNGKINYDKISLRDIDEKKVKLKKLEFGDILIEKSGGSPANPVGRVCFFDKKDDTYLTNNFMSSLRVSNKRFYHHYVFYALFYLYRTRVVLNFQNQTTGIINLKLDRYLKTIKLNEIDISKQKQIADTLDKANELINLRKESIKKLDELSKSIFVDMFGDPFENPKNWESDKLINLMDDVKNGMSRRGNDLDGNIVLKLKDIRANYINFDNPNRIKLKDNELKYIVEKGDILFIRVNGNPDYVGRCAVFNHYSENIYFNDHIMRVKVDKSSINSSFLVFLLNLPYGKMEIKKHRKTSAGQHTISQDGLNKISIYVPPLDLQNEFIKKIEKIEQQKALYEKQLEKLQYNFDALLAKSFEG